MIPPADRSRSDELVARLYTERAIDTVREAVRAWDAGEITKGDLLLWIRPRTVGPPRGRS